MTHAQLTEGSVRTHAQLTEGSLPEVEVEVEVETGSGKAWLSRHAIATYPTRAIATDCLPMEQR